LSDPFFPFLSSGLSVASFSYLHPVRNGILHRLFFLDLFPVTTQLRGKMENGKEKNQERKEEKESKKGAKANTKAA
jgi:hypothetical protein